MLSDSIRRNKGKVILIGVAVVAVLLTVYVVGQPTNTDANLPETVIQKAELGPPENGYHPLLLETNRGTVEGHYYPSPDAPRGVIFIPGVGNSWGEGAKGLYSRLCDELPGEGIACLRMRYRNVDDPLECVLDVVAGIRYLEGQGVRSVALIGHSRGGMIVIYTAAAMPMVRTVVTLAGEGVPGELVARLGPRCSILLIHGQSDEVIPYQTAETLYRAAQEPKRLILYPGADHSLDRPAEGVHTEVHSWIVQQLER